MQENKRPLKRYGFVILLIVVLAWVGYAHRVFLWEQSTHLYRILADREEIKHVVTGFDSLGPVVFILIQFLQVLFAPVPGEATGFIGGFLFGSVKGFVFSTIGLTAGSYLNFLIGRLLGKRYVRRVIPQPQLDRFDAFFRHRGLIIVLICFLIPGFPKDLLSLFLGITPIPVKAFVLMAFVGRMPGTLMLSIQGAFLYEKRYGFLLGGVLLGGLLLLGVYLYRERLYRWIERMNIRL